MTNLVARLTSARDETHRLLSQMIDELRAFERDSRDAVRAAVSDVEAAQKEAQKEAQARRAAARDAETSRSRLVASEEARQAAEAAAAKRVEALETEVRAVAPAKAAAEERVAALTSEVATVERRAMGMARRLAVYEDKLAVAELARSEAERHEGMFRRALYTYLQERDGPAGSGAPTPETLAWIRSLVE